MSKYFKKITSYEDLKSQYRVLLKDNHPDNGGDVSKMQEINTEYDILFAVWKDRKEKQTGEKVTETADSTRSRFYTEFGWEGSNHDWNRSLKEIAGIVRGYVKEKYPTYKFSVRTSYASMCQELHVDLKESPVNIYKSYEELTEKDIHILTRKLRANGKFKKDSWYPEELKEAILNAWESSDFYKVINDKTQAVINDVDAFVNSYNYHDTDAMIDYFDVDFYYFGCVRDNGENIKIVPREEKNSKNKEIAAKEKNTDIFKDFEITESIHTKTGEKIYLARNKEPLTPDEFRAVREQMQGFGGYYSRYTHSFVFKENPLTNFEAKETPLIKENKSIKDSTEPAERKTESNIADALKNRKTTSYGIYHDVGTVLDKFSTMELVNYVIKDVPSGDALLRDYLTNTIISNEINKVKMSESKQTDKPQQKPVRRK